MTTNYKLLQLYGYKTEASFKTTFNKKMCGGVVQNAPPWNSSNRGSQTVRRPGITRHAVGPVGGPNYPIQIYGQLVPGLGPHSSGMPTGR